MVKRLAPLTVIKKHLADKEHFLFSAGAGSGKTYTLVETLRHIYANEPYAHVACITFTNVAVNEIIERAPYEYLHVSTIHNFIWNAVARYQHDIRKALASLIESGRFRIDDKEIYTPSYFESLGTAIEYREVPDIANGIISHVELLAIAAEMFEDSILLGRILADSYDYILVDEYQDTAPEITDILFRHIINYKKTTVGLFGDSMQAIYGGEAWENTRQYIDDGTIKSLEERYNRRNPDIVIDLINRIRNDELIQEPSPDPEANNYRETGQALFLYSQDSDLTISTIKQKIKDIDTSFFDHDLKELYLVKKFIAEEAGFKGLWSIYNDDGVIDYVRNKIKPHVINLNLTGKESVGEVIALCDSPLPSRGRMAEFLKINPNLLDDAKRYSYAQFSHLRNDPDLFMATKKTSEYDTRNRLGMKCDALTVHLMGIQEAWSLYMIGEESGNYNQFMRYTVFPVTNAQSLVRLKKHMSKLVKMRDRTIGEVIEFAHKTQIRTKDERLLSYINKFEYRYNRIKDITYQEVVNVYNYVEDKTPFSTQHGVKGNEFDNVFVLLDNGGWASRYNFQYLFEDTGNTDVKESSRKMFYVCCSRAKSKLFVYYRQPTEEVLQGARKWFGEAHVRQI